MNSHFHNQVKNMHKDRNVRATEQANESLATAQVALVQAQERYARYPCQRNAYRITAARARVEAARKRGGKAAADARAWKLRKESAIRWCGSYAAWLESPNEQTAQAARAAWINHRLYYEPWNDQEYRQLPPDKDLLLEIADRNAARVAPRHPDQPYYNGWRRVPRRN